jgi:hypothetical protein
VFVKPAFAMRGTWTLARTHGGFFFLVSISLVLVLVYLYDVSLMMRVDVGKDILFHCVKQKLLSVLYKIAEV